MFDAFYIAATGLQVGQSQLDTISNNLANLNTMAFKKSRVDFTDLITHQPHSNRMGNLAPMDEHGQGVGVASVSREFSEGDLKQTDNPLDVAIKGAGFLEVMLDNGDRAFTRGGALQVDAGGYLATMSGNRLSDMVQIPPDATKVRIGTDGKVMVTVSDSAEDIEAGQIQLGNFTNPAGLDALGQNLFSATEKSGQAYYSEPGSNGTGSLQQGFLESSNVDLVKELADLVVAQRGYQANSHVLQIADEIMRINNSLRG